MIIKFMISMMTKFIIYIMTKFIVSVITRFIMIFSYNISKKGFGLVLVYDKPGWFGSKFSVNGLIWFLL